MTSRNTDLESLRKELRAMSRGDLLIIAERAIELVPRVTLQALVGDYVHVEDGASEARATPNALLDEVQTFHVDSLAGRYFEDFAVNSRNCAEHSWGTDAFTAEFKRLLRRCISAVDSGQYEVARQAFELLFGLLRHIDEGHDDVIFFADEGGSWQLGAEWRSVFAAYFPCLAKTAAAADFASIVDQMIEDFARHDRPQYLRSAHAVANAAQRVALEPLERRAADLTGG
ncbi:MAG: hypothetical protein DVS81_18930 [Candidatus Accumulibacter meliphilus]|uniref:Uncharacterized protein n=1 Tax=Candidatus Accumulibacter meliphilus TaxID=2211374 RepID=A0A369XLC6_9PROT|nr:MAG: hypothetical protein DVS81_18930 [Candidatus Accumulibacter meliphilus]